MESVMIADTNISLPDVTITTDYIVILGIYLVIYIFWKWITERNTQRKNEIHAKARKADSDRTFKEMRQQTIEARRHWDEERATKEQIEADQLLRLAREGRIHLTDSELAAAARKGT